MTLLESGDFRQQLRAQHHSSLADTDLDDFLNTAFTLEHPNLAIPRDGKIEANRVYDLTEALDIDVLMEYHVSLSPTQATLSVEDVHNEASEYPTRRNRRRRYRFMPKCLRWMNLF